MNNQITRIIETKSSSLSTELNNKLKQARHKALHNNTNKSAFFAAWSIPTAAVATLAIYFVLPLIQKNESLNSDQESLAIISVMETLEQIDLIENLEFYEWLSLEENISSI